MFETLFTPTQIIYLNLPSSDLSHVNTKSGYLNVLSSDLSRANTKSGYLNVPSSDWLTLNQVIVGVIYLSCQLRQIPSRDGNLRRPKRGQESSSSG